VAASAVAEGCGGDQAKKKSSSFLKKRNYVEPAGAWSIFSLTGIGLHGPAV
jgi:hypothetical protein